MSERQIDWKDFVNRLLPCYGCGKLGLPQRGHPIPTGWKMLYQPHPEGKPGLLVCSELCRARVLEAMRYNPINEPLDMPSSVVLPAEVMQSFRADVKEAIMEEEKEKRPNIAVLFPRKDHVPLEEMKPVRRLGEVVRRARVKAEKSLRETAEAVDSAIGGEGYFSPVILGQIERGVRPPDSAEIGGLAKVLSIPEQALLDLAQLWNTALWSDETRKALEPESMEMRSVPTDQDPRLVEELRSASGVMSAAVSTLEMTARLNEGMDPRLAKEAKATAQLLRGSVFRIEAILTPDKQEEPEG